MYVVYIFFKFRGCFFFSDIDEIVWDVSDRFFRNRWNSMDLEIVGSLKIVFLVFFGSRFLKGMYKDIFNKK